MSDNPKFKKDPVKYNKRGEERTGVGKFLAGLKKTGRNIAEPLLDAVGAGDMARAIGIISEDPKKAGLTNDEVRDLMEYYKLDMQDRQNARSIYPESKDQADELADFIMKWNLVGVGFIVLVNVGVLIAAKKWEFDASIVLVIGNLAGMIIQSLLQERAQVVGFYFGAMKQKVKDIFRKD